jgi:photosystem II stability/assembly factor-like uncharacterized protein
MGTRITRRRAAVAAVVAVAVAAAGLTIVLVGRGDDPAGLPATQDYHALLVDAEDADRLVLGTHDGLYESSDGGRHWRRTALAGDDAMNVARPSRDTLWVAGHEVLKRSDDGGATWRDVRPAGLPGLDIHGFAVDPGRPSNVYAAVAQLGLYASTDGGRTFALRSADVGGDVMALVVTGEGTLLAGDMRRGLLTSGDGGRSWRPRVRAQVAGLAVSSSRPSDVLAGGPGVALSTDGGESWRPVLTTLQVGPVAWAASDPDRAYAVGLDRRLYRSDDGGRTWAAVTA